VESLKVARCEQTSILAEAKKRLWRGKSEGEVAERRQWSGVTSSEEMRCSQARRAPFIYMEVEAGATRREFDVQRMTGKLLRHPWNLVIVELILSPILFTAEIHFPPILLHNQGYPKVCPVSLNLLNAGDSFARISSLTSCYLFSRTRDLIASN
jgi:hypothetical protein